MRRKKDSESKSKSKVPKRFDPILKNVFSRTAKTILALAGFKVSRLKPVPTEIRITKRFQVDMLFETTDEIFHIEIQNRPDPSLPERMFEYYFAVHLRQKSELERKVRKKYKVIRQVVIWVGKGKPPPYEYKTETTSHRYKVVDVKEISPDRFLKSKNPSEVILAVVFGKRKEKKKVVQKVIGRLRKIAKSEDEFLRYIDELSIVVKLFDVEVGRKMRWIEIIEDTFLFKEGLKRGLREGRKEGAKEGLKEAIFLDIKVRFGKGKLELVRKKIEKIDDLRKLRGLHMRILKAKDWGEVKKIVDDIYRSITNNVKNKSS